MPPSKKRSESGAARGSRGRHATRGVRTGERSSAPPRPRSTKRTKKRPKISPLAAISSIRVSVKEGRRERALAQSATRSAMRGGGRSRSRPGGRKGDYRIALLALALPFCCALGVGVGVLLAVEEPLSAQEPESTPVESETDEFSGFEPLPSRSEGYELTVGVSAIDGSFALELLSSATQDVFRAGGTALEASVAGAAAGAHSAAESAEASVEAAQAALLAVTGAVGSSARAVLLGESGI